MALTPTLIIERRRNALVAEWRQNPLIVVQVELPAVLPVLTFLDDRGQGAGVGAVGRRSQTNTVIVSRPGDPDRNCQCLGQGELHGISHRLYRLSQPRLRNAGHDDRSGGLRRRPSAQPRPQPGRRRLHPHRGRQFGGQPGLGTAVREGGEQPGLLRQPAPAAANLELDDLRQARQPVSAGRPERRRRHQSAGRLFPDARHGRQRGARRADVDAELRLRRALTYKSMKRSRV